MAENKEAVRTLTLVEKVAKLRSDFAKRDVKKSGKNKYAGFTYFELADMLPVCNELCNALGICPVYSFNEEFAELNIFDSDSDKTITFKIFTNTDDIKARLGEDKQSRGMQPVQRLGSVITYCKRYLYMNFLDLIENDDIDSSDGEERQKEYEKETETLSVKYSELRIEMNKLGIEFRSEDVESWILNKAKIKTQELTELNNDDLKRLNTIYRSLIKGKKDKQIAEANQKAVAEAGGF